MTTGIYILRFNNTEKVYIGQSLDIEDRFIKHKSAFNRGVAAPKLQQGFNTYGMPTLEILVECSTSDLNTYEKEAIEIFNAVDGGFNTLRESGNPIMFGEKSGSARYTNEQYILVLRLLVQKTPTLSKREVEEITGISIYTIRHIAALESHCWLSEICPNEYAELVRIKQELPYYYGKQYPPVKSPKGIVYEIKHVTNFAKEHGLLQPKLTEVLKGTRNHHKGWSLA
jgi:hypothetical protein